MPTRILGILLVVMLTAFAIAGKPGGGGGKSGGNGGGGEDPPPSPPPVNLQSGNVYAQGTATPILEGKLITIELLSPAIGDIYSSSGGLFAVGIHLDQLTLASGTEGLRWNANASPFVTHQLEVTTVPEPSAVGLLSLIAGSVRLRRRYKPST